VNTRKLIHCQIEVSYRTISLSLIFIVRPAASCGICWCHTSVSCGICWCHTAASCGICLLYIEL